MFHTKPLLIFFIPNHNGVTKQTGKQRHQSRADQCYTATGHQLLHALRLGTR